MNQAQSQQSTWHECMVSQLERRAYVLQRQLEAQAHIDPWLQDHKDMHFGERCFILGNGPSLNQHDLLKLRNEVTFGCNGIYKIAEAICLSYFVYVSPLYWKDHVEGIRNVYCRRRFIPRELTQLSSLCPTSWLNVVYPRYWSSKKMPWSEPYSFSESPEWHIFAGGSVLFLAMQIAFYLGFREVVLIGVDHTFNAPPEIEARMRQHGGYCYTESGNVQSHFDPHYHNSSTMYHVDFNAVERGCEMARAVFAREGRRIINATPGTKLETFPLVKYEDLF
jgi:hypothetical protein